MRKLYLLILSQFIGNLSEMNCETPKLLFQEENQGKPKTMEESSKNFLQKLVLGPDRFASEFFLAFKKHTTPWWVTVLEIIKRWKCAQLMLWNQYKYLNNGCLMKMRFFWGHCCFSFFYCKHSRFFFWN